MLKKLLCALLCCACVSIAAGQVKKSLDGIVLDADSRLPVTAALVVLSNSDTAIGTATDSAGGFAFVNVPAGLYDIRISYLGYQTEIVHDVPVESGNTHQLNILLTEAANTMKEIVVTAYQEPATSSNDMAVVSSRAISPAETGRFAGSLNDPSRMALSYAGVNSGQGDNNEIIIRGNSPRGLQWRLEGIEIPNPNHFGLYGSSGGLISILNSNNMDRSDFYLGTFPAQYGNALSGVFDLELRNGNTTKHLYSLEASSLGLNASAEGPFKKGGKASYIANYRYSTLGLMKRMGIVYQAPDFQDLTFKINLPTAQAGDFTIYGLAGIGTWLEEDFYRRQDSTNYTIGANGDTVYAYDEIGAENLQRYNLGIAGIKHRVSISARTYITTHINYAVTQSKPLTSDLDRSSYSIYLKNRGDFVNTTSRGQLQLHTKLNARHRLETGAVVSYIRFSSTLEEGDSTGSIRTILNKKDGTTLLQHYLAWQYKPSQRWNINAGVHTTYFALSDELIPEPRLGVKYLINSKSSVALGGSLHSRHESPEAYYGISQVTGASPNLDLKLSRSAQTALGYKYSFGQYLSVNAELYYQYLYRIPVAADSSYFSLLNEEVPFTNIDLVNEGEGYNYGLEITLEKRFSRKYYFLFTASLYESQYSYRGSGFRDSKYNNGIVTNLVTGKEFHLRKNRIIGLNLRGTYSGGKRYIPVDLDASIANGYEVRNFTQAYQSQLDPYIRTDMSAYFKWIRTRATHTIKLDIFRMYEQNYYDVRYVGASLQRNGNITPPHIDKLAYGEGESASNIFPVISYRVTFE